MPLHEPVTAVSYSTFYIQATETSTVMTMWEVVVLLSRQAVQEKGRRSQTRGAAFSSADAECVLLFLKTSLQFLYISFQVAKDLCSIKYIRSRSVPSVGQSERRTGRCTKFGLYNWTNSTPSLTVVTVQNGRPNPSKTTIIRRLIVPRTTYI